MKLPRWLPVVLIVAAYVVGLWLVYSWINQPSYYDGWLNKISAAEARWQASNIRSYELKGQADWGWHRHFFQVSVVDGQIDSSKCELGYDQVVGAGWCAAQFDAPNHLVPVLFQRARDMLRFGELGCPGEDYFKAEFDRSTGVPTRIRLDCPSAHDEEVEWQMTFTHTAP